MAILAYEVIDDPVLLERCRELDVVFTVCLRLTLNTHDPGFFGSTHDRVCPLLSDTVRVLQATLPKIPAHCLCRDSWLR